MIRRLLPLLAALLLAAPAAADNFVYADALGNFVVLPCTSANGVCTPTIAATVTSASDGTVGSAAPTTATQFGTRTDGSLAAGTAALTVPITCNSSVKISTASSGNVELVALTASETVYVCGWSAVATGTVAIQLIYGTGTACATGETDLTGAYPLVANGGLVDRGDFAVMRGAASNALCIELSGAVQVDGVLYYTKF